MEDNETPVGHGSLTKLSSSQYNSMEYPIWESNTQRHSHKPSPSGLAEVSHIARTGGHQVAGTAGDDFLHTGRP